MKPEQNLQPARALTSEDRELLNLLLEEEGLEFSSAPGPQPAAERGEIPLSYEQERLWFLQQIEPDNAAYNIPVAVRMKGEPDIEILERTLTEVVRRHESLRTTFSLKQGRPIQVISPATYCSLSPVDLRDLPADQREAELQRLVKIETDRAFDLETGLVWRVKLFLLGPNEYFILLVLHHVVSDGWSRKALINEVSSLYAAFREGLPSPLPELPLQYADYAIWQRQYLQGEVLERQLTFWRHQLKNLSILELPTDRPRPSLMRFTGETLAFTLSPDLSWRLKKLSRAEDVTLFVVLMGTFKLWLHRLTGMEDIAVGAPIAGRNYPQLEDLIGCFVNTLVLRTDLGGDPTARELLEREREVAIGAYAHQEAPFARIIEGVQFESRLAQSAIFQTVFAFQNTPTKKSRRVSNLESTGEWVENNWAKFDLTLTMEEKDGAISSNFQYNSSLFDPQTIARFAAQFQVLLESVVADPGRNISSLSLLSAEERRQLSAPTRSPRFYQVDDCLHELFEERVRQMPEAIAVVCEGRELTYGELDRRANILAERLRAMGVGPESVVAMMIERSPEMVTALLAILKAGGAYLPLDPGYPAERLRWMVEDGGAKVAIVNRREQATDLGEHVMALAVAEATFDETGGVSRRSGADPENIAYVIYTSGSTGLPKGVQVTHRNVTRLMAATQKWFDFNSTDVWTLFHSTAFDFSVWEIWGALLYGGRLVIVPYWDSRSSEAFYHLLIDERITVLNQTPSAFRQLMDVDRSAHQPAGSTATDGLSLRLVVFGGEALNPASLRDWYERRAEKRPELVNMYGITETTVHVTYRPLRRGDVDCPRSPLGREIDDLQIHLLERQMEPTARGCIGEIYVGGGGVARGYLGRPELTAERFAPNPFGAERGRRLYRSGDLARYTNNDEWEFIGRADHQVKIRGFRIELGEIESALQQRQHIDGAAVTIRENERGDKVLAGYLVTRRAIDRPTITELRNFLRTRLPEHMIPAQFMWLDRLPLTTNGKIDRKRLPEIRGDRPELAAAYAAPRMEVEKKLADVWAEVLGFDLVGIDDNFFELGGDSILSLRVGALARKAGFDIGILELYRHQTIRELAERIKYTADDAPQSDQSGPFSLIAMTDREKLPDDVEDAYPLTMLQAGMFFHQELTPEAPVYHNVNSWRLRVRFDLEAFERSVQDVVERHPVLRTSFDLHTYTEPLQIVHKQALPSIQVEDLRGLTRDAQNKILDDFLARERTNYFDLSRPPLIRFFIHRCSEDSFQFSLTECHPIFDGWSLNLTIAEIYTRYLARINRRPLPDSAPLSLTFRDFVRLERATMESEECRSYWEEKLRQAVIVRLPRDPADLRESPAAPRYQRLPVPIPIELSDALKRTAVAASAPLKNVLMTAHFKALSLLCGNSGSLGVMGGIVTNGRQEENEGEQVRGLFLNSLPLCVDFSAGSWLDLIHRTFKAEQEMLPYRRYPLITLQRRFGGSPLFETQFNYVNFHALDPLLNSGQIEVIGDEVRGNEEVDYTLDAAFGLTPTNRRIYLNLQFDRSALSSRQIAEIAGYYRNILHEIGFRPHSRHEAVCLLSAEERRQLLVAWQNGGEAIPNTCIHELFGEQAEKTPAAVAVVNEGNHLTYGDLDRRASQLAQYLRENGIESGTPVGALLKDPLATVVAIFGILKAGAAYAPLHPESSWERLSSMLSRSDISVILTERAFAAGIEQMFLTPICMDEARDAMEKRRDTESEPAISGEYPAYIIFTSGSTGLPKGVTVTHRNLAHSTMARSEYYRRPVSRYLLASPFVFDSSVAGLFWTLTTGGTLILPERNYHQDLTILQREIERREVTHLLCLPSLYGLILDQTTPAALRSLTTVIVAGEPCAPSLPTRHHERLPQAELFNEYGPTEGTVWSHVHHCDPSAVKEQIPIGRSIPRAQAYILGGDMQLIPVGVIGDLYIGGPGVSSGYHHHPEQTAEQFIPSPFSADPGSRLYRTGDLARYRPDGEVEFSGRNDQQLKVRGFRVELGEIEAVIGQCPGVLDGCVVAVEDAFGDKRPVACLVATDDVNGDEEYVKTYLRARMPNYLIPHAIVFLERMPLTVGGKKDRQALLEIARKNRVRERVVLPPRNEAERIVTDIWRRVLNVAQIGVHDNFFDLGGHSLLLFKAHGELKKAFDREISMVQMFQYPTVSAIAQYLGGEEPNPGPRLDTAELSESRRHTIESQEQMREARRRGKARQPESS